MRVEVDSIGVSAPPGTTFGITCRDRNDDNFYVLMIGDDGSAAIRKVKWGAAVTLAATGPVNGAVLPAPATNRLRADCVGEMLTLWVNGQALLSAHDRDFRAGRVRLIAQSGATAGAEAIFTDLLVFQP